MKSFKAVPAALCIAVLGAAFATQARADDYDKKTTITFSAPVEIPGVHLKGWGVLPAGTYVFKLLNSSSNRHIVQIFNKDQTKIYATILAIPNYRLHATNKTVMTFNEGVRGNPEALRAWFYPGANWGEEFVYPKSKAVQLAKATNSPVLAAVAEGRTEVATPEELAVVADIVAAPVMAIRPTGEVVEIAQVIQVTPEAAAAPARSAAAPVQVAENRLPKKLPDTASQIPMLGLLGILALFAAFALKSASSRER